VDKDLVGQVCVFIKIYIQGPLEINASMARPALHWCSKDLERQENGKKKEKENKNLEEIGV
jgi:hypothetical protein